MVYLFLHFNQQIPLHYACHSGNSNVVEILIKQPNLKVNKQDEEIFRKSEFLNFFNDIYKTPLHRACESGYIEIVKLLLTHPNIDINSLDKDEVFK